MHIFLRFEFLVKKHTYQEDLGQVDLGLLISLSVQVYLFIWGFQLYQQYFSYLKGTVHKSMFPGLFLTST